ncbi:MAG: hypothetical protein GXO09_02545 [Crenarchaeota archaeon]|nr:hypothetical protein [Thermoproteota archaeon]
MVSVEPRELLIALVIGLGTIGFIVAAASASTLLHLHAGSHYGWAHQQPGWGWQGGGYHPYHQHGHYRHGCWGGGCCAWCQWGQPCWQG